MQDIKDLDLKNLEREFLALGAKPYHARQVFSWLYKRGVWDFNYMSDIPQALRGKLADRFYILGFKLLKHLESRDGTRKILLGTKDNNSIESVLIPANSRVTGCLSSQVGCKYGCSFCASGMLGFKRNLTAGEIIEEVIYLKDNALENRLTHLVFMGTGEPMDNYENVIKAIRIINSSAGLNIGARRITISTNGIIPGIERLSSEGLQLELSVSLHAATDELRSSLMPVNKSYPLSELIQACKEYSLKTHRQVTFEYILIKGLNSSLRDAEGLFRLLKDFKLAKVNLIPSNHIPELEFEPASKNSVDIFKDYLVKSRINVTLRKERGEDINAACGQLRLNYAKN
ncbi:MAG: putative dual-specificity RNA methyltransferase RlmN [Candidatus Omnitrophica bacterium ADurb.Bin205]|nr:MAG: putative dual-specificity RNA methyltransferase RlmN [Candidatus Omnitrophica bacterium ADurb.Bin205]